MNQTTSEYLFSKISQMVVENDVLRGGLSRLQQAGIETKYESIH